ncbi:MAG TPA: DUF4249 domain-containing protein [Rubricoccaceae bacterium]|jgi:hypothetical protein
MRTLPLFVLGLAVLAGCDFSPTLDIGTPAFEPALTVNTVLFADSTVRVRVTRARDPYTTQPTLQNGRLGFATVTDARVTLSRDGAPEVLAFESRQCLDGYDYQTQQEVFVECGFYVTGTPVVGGATYALRAEAPGLPPAEATVRVPARVPATASMVPGTPIDGQPTNRITLRFRDPAGPDDLYGVDALLAGTVVGTQVCDYRGCRDTTYVQAYRTQTSFTTADPILLAGLRGIPGGSNVATFTDDLFDGQERAFTIEARAYYYAGEVDVRRIVRLLALDRTLVDAYLQAEFSLGQDNPFQEPFDLPSNVRGGYGLVGAAAVTEVDLGAP